MVNHGVDYSRKTYKTDNKTIQISARLKLGFAGNFGRCSFCKLGLQPRLLNLFLRFLIFLTFVFCMLLIIFPLLVTSWRIVCLQILY